MSEPWFENPVLPGTHPDPSVCRVGEDYYLVSSSFEYFPGIPLYHSRDLVHWRLLTHVLTRDSQLDLSGIKSSEGIFAPTIRYHDGTFYVITTNIGGGGSFLVSASDPEGPWSDPVWIRESGFTMDPSLFFEADGRAYYTRHDGGRRGAIVQAELDVKTGRLLSDPQRIWAGTGGIWPEGPHLYKLDRTYYLLISEGGTSFEHSVTVARADSPWGSFEPAPSNPLLSHRPLPEHPIQATGHADFVDTPDGKWWAVLLGVRPSREREHHLGRETFLAPVTWENGWPVINHGQPIELKMSRQGLPAPAPWPLPGARDEFTGEKLGNSWIFVRNPLQSNYSTQAHPGHLRLRSSSVSMDEVGSPTAVLQPQSSFDIDMSAQLNFVPQPGQRAGLVIRGNERNHYQLVVEAGRPGRAGEISVLLETTRFGVKKMVKRIRVKTSHVVLRIVGDRDKYQFYAETPGRARRLLGTATTAGTFAYEQTQSFTGAYVGLYAHHQEASQPAVVDISWFELRNL